MRLVVLLLPALVSGALLAEGLLDIEGGWQTEAGKAQERDTMTIRHVGDNWYEVEIHLVYCPSEDCLNARFGGTFFKSQLRSHAIEHNLPKCAIRIAFSGDYAKVTHTGCDSEFWSGGPRGPFEKFSNDPDWVRG